MEGKTDRQLESQKYQEGEKLCEGQRKKWPKMQTQHQGENEMVGG